MSQIAADQLRSNLEASAANPAMDEGNITIPSSLTNKAAAALIAVGVAGLALTVVGGFVGSVPSIIAVIISYLKRGGARGSWAASHYRWQIRTFWFALLWMLIALLLVVTVAILTASAQGRGKVEMVIEGDPLIRLLKKDGIPAIDEPEMITAAEAAGIMKDEEPVIGVFDGKNAHAYPTWFLDGHEIVNDRLGQLPIAATW